MRSTEGYTEWEAGPSKAGATTAASTSTARTNSNNLYNRLHSAVAERVQPHFSLHYVSPRCLADNVFVFHCDLSCVFAI